MNSQPEETKNSSTEEEAAESTDEKNKSIRFRRILSQVLAVGSINFVLLDFGMILALPTIVIPELLKSTEGLTLIEEQASWFGGLTYFFQPVGSAASGFLFEAVGRKTNLFYFNLPLLAGWLLMIFGNRVGHLYGAMIVMGVSIGLMDAPHITYLGEITQPELRGILTSCAELSLSLGYCLVYFLGTFTDWKTLSMVCCSIPILSMLLISRIPESPIWLLSKKRMDEAIQSLCWLRGWVEPDVVREEFSELVRHLEAESAETDDFGSAERSRSGSSRDKKTFIDKLKATMRLDDFCQQSVLLPFSLMTIYFGFSHIAGVTSTRPFMVDILNEFGTVIDPFWVTAISSVAGIAGFIFGMISVPKTGKRFLSITSMTGCALINSALSIYGFFFMHLNAAWTPIFLFILLHFFWSFGIGLVPWMLMSEVFPFKARALASGVTAAISYLEAFVFIKTYYSLHDMLSVSGVFAFYGLCTFCGVFFLYIFLPETEGKTLEEIETILKNRFNQISKKRIP